METKTKQRVKKSVVLKALICIGLIIAAVVSFTSLSLKASSVDTYQSIIESVDRKKTTVTALVTASTVASLGVSALPEDTGTAISQEIAELGGILGIVLIALYLEKYMLPILGGLSFQILFPAACCFFIGSILFPRKIRLKRLGIVLLVVGIASMAAVPTSVYVSDKIDEIYHESIQETIALAEQTTVLEEADETEEKTTLWGTITSAADNLTNGVSHAVDRAKNLLNNFIEATAVLIVTHCVIPIIVVLFYVFLIKQVLSVLNIPPVELSPRVLKRFVQSPTHGSSFRHNRMDSDFDESN